MQPCNWIYQFRNPRYNTDFCALHAFASGLGSLLGLLWNWNACEKLHCDLKNSQYEVFLAQHGVVDIMALTELKTTN